MSIKDNKKKLEEIPYEARRLIRHAYNQALTYGARLVSFSVCPPLPSALWAVEDRQEELALDDLIAFALHIRRLVENSDIKTNVGSSLMDGFVDKERKPIPVIRVVNTIIHHRRIDILRRKSDSGPGPGKDATSLADWLERVNQGHLPIIAIRSDRGGMIGFRIDSFVLEVQRGIIDPIIAHCDDRGLYLENLDID